MLLRKGEYVEPFLPELEKTFFPLHVTNDELSAQVMEKDEEIQQLMSEIERLKRELAKALAGNIVPYGTRRAD